LLIAGAAKEVENSNEAESEEQEHDDKNPLPAEPRETEPDTEEKDGGAENDIGRLSFGRSGGRCQGVIGRAAIVAIDRVLIHHTSREKRETWADGEQS
jgi:hypothetical protein